MNVNIKSKKWKEFIDKEMKKEYFKNISIFINNQKNINIFPKEEDIFKVFNLEPNKIKVVIIGQDPYHGINQANGLSFSVNDGIKIPPSLLNIFKEIKWELNYDIPTTGNLDKWFNNGIFLINSILTVEEGKPLSHKNIGWEIFFQHVLNYLNDLDQPIAFMLLGNNAKKYQGLLNNPKHFIITTSHPSPLGAYKGFIGSGVFNKINNYLLKSGINIEEVKKIWKI